jgi:hypothetical protein
MFIINHYAGFGDNIYHIPFVHQLAKKGTVYMHTPFPELFQFENVVCLPHPNAHMLKLQKENGSGNPLYATHCAPRGKQINFNYGSNFRRGMTGMQSFEAVVPLTEWFFEFKPKPACPASDILSRALRAGKKLCVVRLPSVREEWFCSSRNALMSHFQTCIDHLKKDYYLVAVGDIGNKEQYDGQKPEGIDEHRDDHNSNHLGIWDVVDLIERSDLVLSIQCNMLPICQILRRRAFFIYGGYVPHKALNDSRFFQVGYVEPEPFCFCVDNTHKCRKDIPKDRLISRLEEALCMN